MTGILVVNSSPATTYSVSRQLTRTFVDNYISQARSPSVIERDVGLNPPPHLTEATVGAYFARGSLTPEQQEAIALSDELVAEFMAADVVVIGAPMHNFGVTSGLKAYIDHIVRAGKTFAFSAAGPVGLALGKKVFVLTARGSDYGEGSALQSMDFQETYLRTILGFIGITEVAFIHCQGLAISDEMRAAAIANATSSIRGRLAGAVA
jgi:FMN-dependent NADH-azoreductase